MNKRNKNYRNKIHSKERRKEEIKSQRKSKKKNKTVNVNGLNFPGKDKNFQTRV